MEQYYIYLRKSRKDREAEAHGEGETLARHERALLDLAKKLKLNITKIFREVVSGETISSRPEMQKLLLEVEQGIPAGVLVMEVERLARGDTKDQGTVAEAFKFGNVKIITPSKTYDPNDEFDEEYFEFGLFMSRREYKTINRRLQRGRLASVQEGKYIAGAAPYGYKKVKIPNGKGYTLEVVPDQAEVVRLIYTFYTRGKSLPDGTHRKLGIYLICKELDSLHIKPLRSDHWPTATVKDILTNPTYTGKVRWQWRKCIKTVENGQIVERRPKDKHCMVVDGLHEAIISEDVFNAAQQTLASHTLPAVTSNKVLKNPLSGLICCGKCGKTMTRVKNKGKEDYYRLTCTNRYCKNISSPIYLVEEKLIDALREWLKNYKIDFDVEITHDYTFLNAKKQAIELEEQHICDLKKQLQNTYTLVETGVYTKEIFLERNSSLTKEISDLSATVDSMKEEYKIELSREEARVTFVPKVEKIIDLYDTLDDARSKNQLLKSVLEFVTYEKDCANKKSQRDNANFKLNIYPRIPKL